MKRKKFDDRVIGLIEQNLPYLLRYDGEQPVNKETIIIDRVLPCYAHDAYIGAYPRRSDEYVYTPERPYIQTYRARYSTITNPTFDKRYIPIHSGIYWTDCINPWGLHLIEVSSPTMGVDFDVKPGRINIKFELRNYSKSSISASIPLHDMRFEPGRGYITSWMAVQPIVTGTAHSISYLTNDFAPTIHFMLGGRSPSESYSRTILIVSAYIALNVMYLVDYGYVQLLADKFKRIYQSADLELVRPVMNNYYFKFQFTRTSCEWIVEYSKPSGDPETSLYSGKEPPLYLTPIPYDHIDYEILEFYDDGDLPEIPDRIIFDKEDVNGKLLSKKGDRSNIIISVYNLAKGVSYYEKAMRELNQAFEMTGCDFWIKCSESSDREWAQSGSTLVHLAQAISNADVAALDSILPILGVALQIIDVQGVRFIRRIQFFPKTTTGEDNNNPYVIKDRLQGENWFIPQNITMKPDGSLHVEGYSLRNGILYNDEFILNPTVHNLSQLDLDEVNLQVTSNYHMVKTLHKAVVHFLGELVNIPPYIQNDLIHSLKTISSTVKYSVAMAREARERYIYNKQQADNQYTVQVKTGTGRSSSQPHDDETIDDDSSSEEEESEPVYPIIIIRRGLS